MSEEAFIKKRFNNRSLDLIKQCNAIITDYLGQGLRLTLRQLYYQLVTKNVVPNVERSYKNLSGLVSDARLAGLMDWEAIEDRVRRPRKHQEYDNIQELVEAALYSYRLPRWQNQDHYVELWVEKDALAGVLEPIAMDYHITMMVNRGYSSQSAMYDSARRFLAADGNGEKKLVLFYLGDHDPSGEDMVRDIADRLKMFGVPDLQVRKLALTMDQIKKYNPPPNPAKMTDPRAGGYVAKHGDKSWEVDALPPSVLNRLIRSALDRVVDKDRMEIWKEREESDKAKLKEAAEAID